MRVCSVLNEQGKLLAVRRGAELIDVSRQNPDSPTEMHRFLDLPDAKQRLSRSLDTSRAEYILNEANVTYLPAVERPGKILCLGTAGHAMSHR